MIKQGKERKTKMAWNQTKKRRTHKRKWNENKGLWQILFIGSIVAALAMTVAGCGQGGDAGKAGNVPAASAMNEGNASSAALESNAAAHDEEGSNVNFEIETGGKSEDAPADQGDPSVWINATAKLENERVVITGTTNLLPGAKMKADLTAAGYNMWGYNDEAEVGRDGTFKFDIKQPNIKEGTLDITISFVPEEQAGEMEAYGKDGGKLTGPYIHQYEESDQVYQKAVAFIHVNADPEKAGQEWRTEIPGEKPEDYGSPAVWITPVISFDGKRYLIKGTSNLLEGVKVEADVDIPDHWHFGYGESARVMPDGSFSLQMKKPDKVDTFYIVLKVVPDEDMPKAAKEAYGANGEKFDGELVKAEQSDQGSISVIQLKMKIKEEQ
ncbi:hypothetical protein [Paenibacillus woosongensis]|nr:hypothetical protein [Paenibacillus woosongensis]